MDNPTTHGGMQNGRSVGICTRCVHAFARLAPIFMLSRCLFTKFLRRSSAGSLSRVRCWLGRGIKFFLKKKEGKKSEENEVSNSVGHSCQDILKFLGLCRPKKKICGIPLSLCVPSSTPPFFYPIFIFLPLPKKSENEKKKSLFPLAYPLSIPTSR